MKFSIIRKKDIVKAMDQNLQTIRTSFQKIESLFINHKERMDKWEAIWIEFFEKNDYKYYVKKIKEMDEN